MSPRNSSMGLRSLVAVPVLVLTLATAAITLPASPAGATTPQQQQEQVRQQKAKLAAQLNALKATDAQVNQALSDLDANVKAEQAALVTAQRAAEAAAARVDAARAAEAAAQARVNALGSQLKRLAISAYVNPSVQGDAGLSLLTSQSANELAERDALVRIRANRNVDLEDQAVAARQDLHTQRLAADDALHEANLATAAANARVNKVKTAKDQQQQFAASLNNRINSALAEAAGLQDLDSKLSAQIAAEAAAQARRTQSPGGGSRSGTGRGPGGTQIQLRTVRGITVAASIADNLDAMLGAAAADGFVFGGGGYRSDAAQIALRQAHCGTSYYDIWQKPASECHPPTAPPGSSMHELGLAIDFTWHGSVIQSHSSPAFQWLAAHAAKYGLYNLPSEPWHWSVNGD